MANALIEEVTAALAEFSGTTRLIDLSIGERGEYGLLAEASWPKRRCRRSAYGM